MADQGTEVGRLAAIEAIGRLLVAYGRALDARDYAGYARLFAEDGEWVGGTVYGAIRGRAAIEAFVTETFGGPAARPCVHVMTNFAIDVVGDAATVWSRWTLLEPRGDGAPHVALCGQYDDELVRSDGTWLFRSRSVTVDFPA